MSLHTFPDPAFDAAWLAGEGLPREHGRDLLRLLAALARSSSLRDAARACGLSYRYAWGVIGEGARALGGPLVDMGRGRGARLTELGRRVLDADQHVRSALDPLYERLRTELRGMLAGARCRRVTHRLQKRLVWIQIFSSGAEDCLAGLARNECELAGFHIADALPRAAAAAAALGQWLDPRKHQLVHFVTREQGLIVRPGTRIRGVNDLARPGVRFAGRPPQAGHSANADLRVAEEVAAGRADAGFGLRAAASRLRLDFVPLAKERYFLAAARRTLRAAPAQALLRTLRGKEFASAVGGLPGYDPARAGEHESIAAALSWIERSR